MVNVEASAEIIRLKIGSIPDLAIVLGSGLNLEFSDIYASALYSEIPGFIVPTVKSHLGKILRVGIAGREVLIMSGRSHFYEGYSLSEASNYVRILNELGVKKLILTNAAGAINPDYSVGDLTLISDHINFFGSPLRGAPDRDFIDLSDVYSRELRRIALESADEINLSVRQGVYAFMPGPQYETPAEIRALKIMGADVVGMSTVPEAIMAAFFKMKTLGVSYISNYAAGITGKPITHKEVVDNSQKARTNLMALLNKICSAV